MTLIGHPTGNPNSHHAALCYWESGKLEAFCVPWFPTATELRVLGWVPGLRAETERLARRHFPALQGAPMVQGRSGEWGRLLRRMARRGSPGLAYEANDWLMRTMARAARRPTVTAVHSYEDCSLWQFEEAKRLGKKCVYDMPTCFFPWWQRKESELQAKYADWADPDRKTSGAWARPEQKRLEMDLADVVLCPSSFVEGTIKEYVPRKLTAVTPYGVDGEFWSPGGEDEEVGGKRQEARGEKLRFIYAGQSSIRKGIPVLIEAWEKAELRDAELLLVGGWQLAKSKLRQLPRGVRFIGPVSPERLRKFYRSSDIFVFPTFSDGFGLVILEALACGLPVIASDRSAGPDVLDETCGRVVTAGDAEQIVETLRWCGANQDRLPQMKRAARAKAESFTWSSYREAVSSAVAPFA